MELLFNDILAKNLSYFTKIIYYNLRFIFVQQTGICKVNTVQYRLEGKMERYSTVQYGSVDYPLLVRFWSRMHFKLLFNCIAAPTSRQPGQFVQCTMYMQSNEDGTPNDLSPSSEIQSVSFQFLQSQSETLVRALCTVHCQLWFICFTFNLQTTAGVNCCSYTRTLNESSLLLLSPVYFTNRTKLWRAVQYTCRLNQTKQDGTPNEPAPSREILVVL